MGIALQAERLHPDQCCPSHHGQTGSDSTPLPCRQSHSPGNRQFCARPLGCRAAGSKTGRDLGDGDECRAAIPVTFLVSALILIFWRMPARFDPLPPHIDREQIVELKGHDSCAATDRQSDDARAVAAPGEMAFPLLTAWIEELDAAACNRIAPVSLNPFESIAEPTSQPKVFLFVRSVEGFGVDMLHFEQAENIFLGADAISATISSLSAHAALRGFGNAHDGFGWIVMA